MVDSVRITEEQDISIVSILARRGVSAAAIGAVIAIDMPRGPTATTKDDVVWIGNGPGTWMAFGRGAGPGWPLDLTRRFAGLASVSDQTGAYRLFRIEGSRARTLLQRGAALDLHNTAFPACSVAVTVVGHVDIIIRCLPDGHSYEVAVYRSYAESFLRWVDSIVAGL